MQIHDTKAASGAGNPQFTPETAARDEPLFGFDDPNLQSPISGNTSTGLVKTLTEKLKEIYEESLANRPNLRFELIVQDNNVDRVYFSTITAALCDKATGHVATYTLLLEATNELPRSKTESYAGSNIEVLVPAGEAYDNMLREQIGALVVQAFPQTRVMNAGAGVLTRLFNIEDAAAVRGLARLTSDATWTVLLESNPKYSGVNLAAARNDNSLRVAVSYQRQVVIDRLGQLHRSDAQIDFLAQSNDQTKSLNNLNRRGENLSRAHMYVDAIWAPVQQAPGIGQYGAQVPANTPKYLPHCITTHMENNKVATTQGFLMTIITTLALAANHGWAHPFYRGGSREEGRDLLDLSDIGILNLEADVFNTGAPGVFDTKSATFGHAEFGAYIHMLFRPTPVFSFDIAYNGANSYALGLILQAARGDKNAVEQFVNECDRFTASNFSKYFGNSPALFTNQNDVQLLGYYSQTGGTRRPISDFDYIAVANQFLKKEKQVLTLWSESFLNRNIPVPKRLDDRRKIIQSMAPSAVFTDYAIRVTPTDALLHALTMGAKDAGLVTTLTTGADSVLRGHERASGFDNMQGAQLSSSHQPIFTQATAPGFDNSAFRSQYWG